MSSKLFVTDYGLMAHLQELSNRLPSHGCHVEEAANLEAPALNAASPAARARVVGHRRYPDERGDLALVEPSELRQFSNEGGAGQILTAPCACALG
ncbi:hypothetical protein EV691_13827 [Azotobacter chroococcum]|uniref:Uncharacterized protein n=1 Tax=Azotobacter chroococcum TaxID=353 RepID=A0A4R1PFB6_9GAMM|nr:hypothetical protein EV691_13827 [Azotobacter chroococcum]